MLACCAALVTSSNAQTVKIDFDKNFNFSKVRRYQWRTHPIFEKHPDLLNRYSTSIQLVMNATNEQLMNRGYQPVSSAPDVFLTFFVSSREVKNTYTDMIDPIGPAYGWYGWYIPPAWTVTTTEQYLEGDLVMDMVDPAGSDLIWRASAAETILDYRTRGDVIYAAVKKIFGKFPPKEKTRRAN